MFIAKSSFYFLKDLWNKKRLIIELVKRDLASQVRGSYLGFVWIFLQPLSFIFVLYCVFTLGLRTGSHSGIPFVVYLVSGIVAWMFFADGLGSASNSISSHSFLIKKVDFRLSILPLVKIVSSLFIQSVLIIAAITVNWMNGYAPSIYTFQIVYYMFSLSLLLLGFGWISSSTSLFANDVTRIIALIVQFGFWLTPIIWNISIIPQKYQWIAMLNPVFYIVNGYRESLIYKIPFWNNMYLTFYYWAITSVVLFLGISIFRRLRPHFAEVV